METQTCKQQRRKREVPRRKTDHRRILKEWRKRHAIWLAELLTISDRPLVAKGIDFQIQNNGRKLTFFQSVSLFL